MYDFNQLVWSRVICVLGSSFPGEWTGKEMNIPDHMKTWYVCFFFFLNHLLPLIASSMCVFLQDLVNLKIHESGRSRLFWLLKRVSIHWCVNFSVSCAACRLFLSFFFFYYYFWVYFVLCFVLDRTRFLLSVVLQWGWRILSSRDVAVSPTNQLPQLFIFLILDLRSDWLTLGPDLHKRFPFKPLPFQTWLLSIMILNRIFDLFCFWKHSWWLLFI